MPTSFGKGLSDRLHIYDALTMTAASLAAGSRCGTGRAVARTGCPAGETVFVALGEEPLEPVIECIPDAPLFGDGDTLMPGQVLRHGRIAERTGDAPAGGPTVTD